MAPKGSPGKKPFIHEIDRTAEYEEFIQKLKDFHEKRGTSFEPEPRLPTMHGHVNVDLLKLYRKVIEKGGYDELGKVQKAWAGVANDLGMFFDDGKGMGQLSFQLKQDFYRYLGAFWIEDQYGKEPPPREILEQVSCATKFGPILTRTVESFRVASNPGGEDTPVKDKDVPPAENTPVSGNRASGRLREAPPQRIPFQPETGPSRASRQSSSQHNTSTANSSHPAQQNQQGQHPPPQRHDGSNSMPHYTPQPIVHRGPSSYYTPPANSETASRLSDLFEPRPPVSVALRPVNTPSSNPAEFAKRQRQVTQQLAGGDAQSQVLSRSLLPGAGFEGPNIYTRCLQSLRSCVAAEQAFALNHLVKISFERGDKYKFESFPGLAEGLIEKALEVGSLFYDVEWQAAYFDDVLATDISVLDGMNGTADILERIAKLRPKPVLDYMQSAEFSDRLIRVTESVLTLRNMVMLQDNAIYMAEVRTLKDLLAIILHLPELEMLVEVKHFCLDIAEQLTPWLTVSSEDPLYQTLLLQLGSADRGTILTALRAISRISMNLEATNKLEKVPAEVLRNIMDWLLLNDEELMDACLDFLYQYTAVVRNVESLLVAVDMERVVTHLVRLLAHGAKRVREERILQPERKVGSTEEVAPLPQDLHERLSGTEEPQRCFQWLKSLFEEDRESNITQIAIWQAYQSSFATPRVSSAHTSNTLSAADFIRNVSSVFANARAQIIRGPGEAQKFIIEGIRARTSPLDPDTKEEYSKCEWGIPSNAPGGVHRCGRFFPGGQKMWQHVLADHLGQSVNEDGTVEDEVKSITCNWIGCAKYRQPTPLKLSDLTNHLKTHISTKRSHPDGLESMAKRQRKLYVVPAKTMSIAWEQTLVTRDERKPQVEQAAGIPLSAVLVLRNVARNVVKTDSEEEMLKKVETGEEAGGWNEKLFRPVMARLFEIMTENKALAGYISSLLTLVADH